MTTAIYRGPIALAVVGFGMLLAGGCEQAPPAVQPTETQPQLPAVYPLDTPKPLPPQIAEPPAPAYEDAPLVDTRLPEEAWFVGVYDRVGHPRIAVFVNRTLDGNLIEGGDVPLTRTETIRSSNGSVDVSESDYGHYGDYWHWENSHAGESFRSTGPAEYRETTTTYLHPGDFDAAQMGAFDYQEVESLLTNWLRCSGQVTLVAPDFIRDRLSPQQLSDAEHGNSKALRDVQNASDADVLVQVQAHPIRREFRTYVLMLAEAVDVRGGEILAQASVEMPAPVDQHELNNFTRFLARKLMHEMAQTWESAPSEPASPPQGAPMQTPPLPGSPAPAPIPPANPAQPLPSPAPGNPTIPAPTPSSPVPPPAPAQPMPPGTQPSSSFFGP